MRLMDRALLDKWEAAERSEPGRFARPFILGQHDDENDRAKAALMGLGLMVRAIDGEPEMQPLLSLLASNEGQN